MPVTSPARFALRSSVLAAAVLLAGCAATPRPATPPVPPAASAPAPAPAAQVAAEPASPGDATTLPDAAGFAAWLAGFERDALAAGIRPETVRGALHGAQFEPRVVEFDRAQPEFTRPPWAYLDSAVSAQRVAQGQAKLAAYRAPLDAAAQRYGVPAAVITAIWGIESNYGSNFGTFRAVDALATLAYEGRRRAWAAGELIAALRIVDNGDIDAAHMVGSWAGALGHTQFLPSVFLAHAVDADGDGRRDIWGSVPDVAASTANFLAHSGWQRGQPWGVEVRLPPGFDHARETSMRQGAAQWAAEGVQSIDGQPLPALEGASVIAPAGARGPAFLVGPNFRAILRYNNAVSYALAVGLLARQIDGGPGIAAPWPRDLQPLSRSQTRLLQAGLNARGFDAGAPDGLAGPATRAALRRYQQSVGAPVADGYPTLDWLQRAAPPSE